MFPRHAHVLPRLLQDVRVGGIIKACKTCGQAATVPCYSVAPCGWPLSGTVGRDYDPTG
jgi:hypothetical protein